MDYFNYFTEVEDQFCRRRGGAAILSPADFHIVQAWHDAGVPLEAVLRGIDNVFDKRDSGPYTSQRVNSIRYCSQAVLGECERMRESSVGVWKPE